MIRAKNYENFVQSYAIEYYGFFFPDTV